MLKRLFKPRVAVLAGQSLYERVVVQARSPRLYAELGAPDTTEGRFEIYSLHVYLLLERLKEQGPQAAETAQALLDTYLSALDNTLREMGLGDVGVGRQVRKLGEAFYGRIRSYEIGMAALPDTSALEAVLIRTAYAGADPGSAPRLADYIVRQRTALASAPLEDLFSGNVAWIDA
jgi:cytochrome b pre-mRNA-processing protein 3